MSPQVEKMMHEIACRDYAAGGRDNLVAMLTLLWNEVHRLEQQIKDLKKKPLQTALEEVLGR